MILPPIYGRRFVMTVLRKRLAVLALGLAVTALASPSYAPASPSTPSLPLSQPSAGVYIPPTATPTSATTSPGNGTAPFDRVINTVPYSVEVCFATVVASENFIHGLAVSRESARNLQDGKEIPSFDRAQRV